MIYIIGWIFWTRKMITLFIIFLARFVLFPAPFFSSVEFYRNIFMSFVWSTTSVDPGATRTRDCPCSKAKIAEEERVRAI